ncbi:hypothetical protein BFW87_14885 [Pseudomonas fluorescens]|uniref:Uncharacterized protein n=1 Tax=Pseudomonas fluorescens TaxID=294 RepID=A0A1T2YUT1_PSEFL|nr:hypothetical protein BFW87_14885 [Pseudomonas fluorescens]
MRLLLCCRCWGCKHRRTLCGSWLACDAGTSVFQLHRGDAIAGKPAPTEVSSHIWTCVWLRFRRSAGGRPGCDRRSGL